MTSASDPFQILGLKPGATEIEIKQAYRKLARQWHPDQFQDPGEKQKAEAKIKRINIAYSQLKDPNFEPESNGHNASASQPASGATVQKTSQAQRLARAQSYFRQAQTLEQAERYQDATKALTLAINLIPDYAEAYQYRAYLYDLRGFEFLAAKDQKKAKILGLEKRYRSAPQAESPTTSKTTPKTSPAKRWRPKGWGESSRPKPSDAPAKNSVKSASRSSRSNAVRDRSPSKPASRPVSASGSSNRSSTGVFSSPTPMAAVNQAWDCTARLKSPATDQNGAIAQLMPYGSTNGISASANGTLRLWNFERGYDFAELKGHRDEVLDFALNADGQLLASTSRDGTIKLWHLPSASLTRSFEAGQMTSLVFGPDRHTLSCCNAAGEVRLWSSSQESGSSQSQASLNSERWASQAATYLGLSSNRKILIRRSPDRSLHRHWLEDSAPARPLAESQFEQTCIALSPSSRHLAAGDRTGLLRLWNLQTAEPVMAIQGRAGTVKAIAFTPDNRLMASLCKTPATATGESATFVQIWSRPSREHLCDLTCDRSGVDFRSLCFSGDSKRLIIGDSAGELSIWQPAVRS